MNKGPEYQKNPLKSFNNYPNNRSTTAAPPTFGSGLTTAIGAVVAPVMDFFTTTRRNDYPSNVRLYGDPGSTVPSGYIKNINTAPKTIKETTLFTPPLGIITNQSNKSQGSYVLNNVQPVSNQRSSCDISYFGDAGGGATKWGNTDTCGVYSEHVTKESTMMSRTNQGNMKLFNDSQGKTCIAKPEKDRENPRQWVPTNMPSSNIGREMYGDTVTPQCYDNVNRNEPSLLDAFRENPYTHSLASF